jgi:RHS repeat-associated protein
VGNRLSETTHLGTTTYAYDDANRLADVNGVAYTWDDNGNLLSDGVNTYTYDHANRLTSVVGPSSSSSYAYNGLGDRLQGTVDGVTTDYSLDLNNWLTQILADDTNTYLYGTARIAQYDASGAEFFLADGLGSVRQLADSMGVMGMAEVYEPFGEVLNSSGAGATNYGFANEHTSQGLIYLRARWYSPQSGRFLTKDSWPGDFTRPMSYNDWLYVYANPVNDTDPTGQITADESYDANQIVKKLLLTYNITIETDWGPLPVPIPMPPTSLSDDYSSADCGWNQGHWRSLMELNTILDVAERYSMKMGGAGAVRQALGGVRIRRLPTGTTETFRGTVRIANYIFDQPNPIGGSLQKEWGPKVAVAHELAHYWDWKTGNFLSQLLNLPGAIVTDMTEAIEDEPGPTSYARTSIVEDWAESVAGYLYPVYFDWLRADPKEWRTLPNGEKLPPGLGPLHEAYVKEQFHR